jgi:hypothetical protein
MLFRTQTNPGPRFLFQGDARHASISAEAHHICGRLPHSLRSHQRSRYLYFPDRVEDGCERLKQKGSTLVLDSGDKCELRSEKWAQIEQ